MFVEFVVVVCFFMVLIICFQLQSEKIRHLEKYITDVEKNNREVHDIIDEKLYDLVGQHIDLTNDVHDLQKQIAIEDE